MLQNILVMSDIHGNIEALKAVLSDAELKFSEIWVLGDIAGYGPNPVECLKLLRKRNAVMVPGNHDWAVCGKLDMSCFNSDAATAIEIHKKIMGSEQKAFLADLPLRRVINSVHISHGHPDSPLWGYVLDTPTAAGILAKAQTSLTLLGHSHLRALWAYDPYRGARLMEIPEGEVISYSGVPHLANPGSVGQSRDGDNSAKYLLLNPVRKTLEFRSCTWRQKPLRRKMQRAGYPEELINKMTPGNK